MKVNVIGKQKVSFKDKESGDMINGVNIYYICTPSRLIEIEGQSCGKKFFKNVSMSDFETGYEYDFDFDEKGRLVDFHEVV